jgi:cellulose synthase/poly-beta-1,6-N-acetylglucosamine synthase-like glycosyltransferase
MIRDLLLLLLSPVAGAALASSLYVVALTVLAAAASLRRRSAMASPRPSTRFAVLVPAHNEEAVLGRLLESLQSLHYPLQLFDVLVIADNCRDGTESVARSAGARVLTRRDLQRQGKGHALAWALKTIPLSRYGAVVMIDADSVVDRGFLRAMDVRLAAGAQAVQGYYGVLTTDSTASALRGVSFALMHFVRPLGKSLFGGSTGLKGNGMAFSSSLLVDLGWRSFSIVEDAEQHVRLVEAGIDVEFAPEARVWGEMPSSLRRARSQNLRWEAGRWKVARRSALPLIWRGLRQRSLALVDAGVEILIPPLSVVAALGTLAGVSGLALGSSALLWAGFGTLGGLGVHVIGGLLVVRAPFSAWRSLLAAPVFLIWKVALYAQALLGGGADRWVRTPRASSED